jgi:HAD superfamily hydrolase (TIGR01459 family)
MRPISGLAAICDRYRLFLIDQFGTLHDGGRAYGDVLPTLRMLKAADRRVILLSNSGKRAAANVARLSALGVPQDAYDEMLTSGELAWRLLKDGAIPTARGLNSCLLLARGGDRSVIEGLDIRAVRASEAEVVVIAGSEGERIPLTQYADILAPAARRGTPCLCLNPDKIMITPQGLAFGAGRIGELYEDLGGTVIWIGKPHRAIYEVALGRAGDPDPADVVGIGDSMEHDIAGAASIGAASALVRTGIAADASDAAIAAAAARYGASPDFVLAAFRWEMPTVAA